MECKRIIFSGHAIRRMFERSIRKPDVLGVVGSGEIIAEYPDDVPFPSYLILGFANDQPVHVVVALDRRSQTCHIITVYVPDLIRWQADFKTRRSP
jgi:hypothetical protein